MVLKMYLGCCRAGHLDVVESSGLIVLEPLDQGHASDEKHGGVEAKSRVIKLFGTFMDL
jgi:hypothetical protein